MPRSVKNTARLLSLTALGAATLAGGPGEAQATIFWSGPITSGNNVGFDAGFLSHATLLSGGLGPAKLKLTLSRRSTNTINLFRRVIIKGKSQGGQVAPFRASLTGLSLLKPFNMGNAGTTGARRFAVQAVVAKRTTFGAGGKQAFNNFGNGSAFALFYFYTAAAVNKDFGWAKLAVKDGTAVGPDVTLKSYAFSDDHKPLAAGNTGGTVPEPSSGAVEVTAFAALILGGPALRRWRTARRSQQRAA